MQRKSAVESLTNKQANDLLYDWEGFWARPKQLAPPGDWSTWIIRAGRGFGKTRSGSGWVQSRAMAFPGRWIALVARTPADARDYMIEGPGGILKNARPEHCPNYESSKKRLTWPNGSWSTIYSDEEPDQLRGFSGDTAWLDEFAKFKNAKAGWDNLQFGMREASTDRPRRLITTTPRPIKILTDLEALPSTRVVVGSSRENRKNLDPSWFNETLKAYEGTRVGRQEIEAEILTDVPGALWTLAGIDDNRVNRSVQLQRVVIGVDPSGTSGEDDTGDSIGIVAVGLGIDDNAYVLADHTCKLSPAGWGRRVVDTYHSFKADRIVAERNFGGAMVEHVVRTSDRSVAYRDVTASRGKIVRAEPIAALYEQGRVKHVGAFSELEDQLCKFTATGYLGKGSPDRVDALVWALTDLTLGQQNTSRTIAAKGMY